MDDKAVERIASIVSERVFREMMKFIEVLEGVVRENERLQAKLTSLELMVFGPPDDDDDDGAHEDGCGCDDYEAVPNDELEDFFDIESAWEPEPEEDDGEPTFD